MAESTCILVYIQCDGMVPVNASLEALSKARELAKETGAKAGALLLGSFDESAENVLKEFGAQCIIKVDLKEYNIQSHGEALAGVIGKYTPALVLAGNTPQAKDVFAYTAAKLDLVSTPNVSGITKDLGFTIALYGGAVLREVEVASDKTKLAIAASGAFKKLPEAAAECEVVVEEFPEAVKDLRTILKESVTEIADSLNLEEAQVIVACGRGICTPEGVKLAEDLAAVLGGAVGATRPVTESGEVARTQQIGQSGKIVAPKLYIGCGVSGAVQHIAGILGADYIVAINKDEDAPIFEVADVGIVGDAMVIMPMLMEEFKKLKA